ncbi:DHH family phosphoesterase [Mycoplasma todarodis]|uniref:DHH family phosphoesterase n=1 Tax=Mycoplasma todarodis TaxID=1937191 RepID=UPI003B393DC4
MNKKHKIFLLSLLTLAAVTLVVGMTLIGTQLTGGNRTLLLILFTTVSIVSLILVLGSIIGIRRQRVEIKKSFDYYIEELISSSGIGTIIFNSEGIIIWSSKFISERFNNRLIGKNVGDISKEFQDHYHNNKTDFTFKHNNIFYEASIITKSNSIILRDVTEKASILEQYKNEKSVVAELDIDNFQEYQSLLPEEEIFAIQSTIMKMLDSLVDKHNIIYRQYVNGKFMIFTDNETLDKLIKDEFSVFTKINTALSINGVKLTVSVGIGVGSTLPNELMSLAKEAITQSQNRGGDQVTVAYQNQDYKYFGAETEAVSSSSRVKISQISKIIVERLSDPKIKNVIVYGHKFADLDALGATRGIVEMARAFDKKSYIVNATFDNTTKKAIKQLVKSPKELFIKPTQADKFSKSSTLVFICDTAEPTRTENPNALKGFEESNIFILDHHRVTKLPEGIHKSHTYVDTAVSSASEIVAEIIQFSKRNIKISHETAQLLLAGIYLDTKQFQKQVSSRTFAAASWLESFGATANVATNLLKLSESQTTTIRKILTELIEVKPGYYLATYDGEADSDVISVAADEILRTEGRRAAFVIAKIPGSKLYKLSARSIDVNVQLIAERVGGGGHFAASAAVSEESLSIFADNLIQAIVSVKNESNNN